MAWMIGGSSLLLVALVATVALLDQCLARGEIDVEDYRARRSLIRAR
jgi:hypothetical protein